MRRMRVVQGVELWADGSVEPWAEDRSQDTKGNEERQCGPADRRAQACAQLPLSFRVSRHVGAAG
jgi:hypothetical protein